MDCELKSLRMKAIEIEGDNGFWPFIEYTYTLNGKTYISDRYAIQKVPQTEAQAKQTIAFIHSRPLKCFVQTYVGAQLSADPPKVAKRPHNDRFQMVIGRASLLIARISRLDF